MEGKKRILVVDDEKDITFVLEMMLNDFYDVDAYTDPVEALASVRPHKYDLVLFDYMMPKTNGYEFYHKVKEVDPNVNICMMTAYDAIPIDKNGNMPVRPFDSRFVLKKPFDMVEMIAKFNEIMNDKR